MNIQATQRARAAWGVSFASMMVLSLGACGGSSSHGGASGGKASGNVASGSAGSQSSGGTGGSSSGGGSNSSSRGPDATAATLQTAQVPANCDMPATRLVGGKTPAQFKPREGGPGEFATDIQPLTLDMTGAGSKQVLWSYGCTAGGVSWPEILVLNDAKGNLVGSVKLSDIDLAEHGDVTSWSVNGKNVDVQWKAYEGAGSDVREHHSTLSWSGGKLQLKDGGAPGSGTKTNAPAGAAPGAGGARPANATPLTEKYSDQYSSMPAFKTPSGKNGCQVNEGWIRCGTTSGGEVFMNPDGQITAPAADDAPMYPQADVLAYGQVRYRGDTVFASTDQGVTVWNTKTGHGALINTSGVQKF